MVPGGACNGSTAFFDVSAIATEEASGMTAVAAVAMPAAPTCDRNDLLLSFPSEDAGSFLISSSIAKFHLRIADLPVGGDYFISNGRERAMPTLLLKLINFWRDGRKHIFSS
jgi:hypothetical protein